MYLSEHFHQKTRQHAIVIAGPTLHLQVIGLFLSLQSNFVLLLLRCRDY